MDLIELPVAGPVEVEEFECPFSSIHGHLDNITKGIHRCAGP